jgi:nucleoside-diphosphate-sugar epimerase
MRIAFIGGTRFIGHAAAERAIARGHDVAVLHRGDHACEIAGARDFRVDRNDADALRLALRDSRAEVVIDTRAMTAADAELSAAVVASLHVPVVVLSSQDVYAQFGSLNGHPAPRIDELVREDAPLTVPYPFRGLHDHEGGSDYDKKDVERTFLAACHRVIVLRLPAVYGKRDRHRRFGALIDALDDARKKHAKCTIPCKGGAPFRWTHAHVGDVAHAIVLAAENARDGVNGVFNVGEPETPPMRTRAEKIATAMGVGIEWSETSDLPEAWDTFGVQPNDFVVDDAKIRDVLGFREVITEKARVQDVIAWARATRREGSDTRISC